MRAFPCAPALPALGSGLKDLRAQIAQARKALTMRIMALGQMAKRQFRNRDRPEK